jgi:prefoldin subunit 5
MQESAIVIKLFDQLQQKSEEIALLRQRISALESEIAILKHSKKQQEQFNASLSGPFSFEKDSESS